MYTSSIKLFAKKNNKNKQNKTKSTTKTQVTEYGRLTPLIFHFILVQSKFITLTTMSKSLIISTMDSTL